MAGLGAAVVTLAFYLYAAAAVLGLCALLILEFLMLLVGARFGLARFVAAYIGRHGELLTALILSFRPAKEVDSRVALSPEDAPELHAILARLCGQLELGIPREVFLEMSTNAWVRLHGLSAGGGKTKLGIGYDLMAGLSAAEIESVLAHEMAHAKLIKRGFKNWLTSGQRQMRTLDMMLWGNIEAHRRANRDVTIAPVLMWPVSRMVRLSTRFVAAYTRQLEFEADHGAAELCGSTIVKSALSKLEALTHITSRLPWPERVAQMQEAGGYSDWLLREIAHGTAQFRPDAETARFNEYSTHPSIKDRILALPPDNNTLPPDSPPGLRLLRQPDDMAGKLIAKIQRLMAEQEERDSRRLEKLSKRSRRNIHMRPLQIVGFLLILAGFIVALFAMIEIGQPRHGAKVAMAFAAAGLAIAGGFGANRLGAYRDKVRLPVPTYEEFTRPRAKVPPEEFKARQQEIERELSDRVNKEGKSARRMEILIAESYKALETCDFARAHVAARMCLKHDKKSVPGALAAAVACAAFGQVAESNQLIFFAQRQTGLNTFSTAWSAGWSGYLTGDAIRAEAMFERVLKFDSSQTTVLALLAIVQNHRGKRQSALMNARRVCEVRPESKEHLKYLIARLVENGYTREAFQSLARFDGETDTTGELSFLRAQASLLKRNFDEADKHTENIRQTEDSAKRLLRLAQLNETARRRDQAAALYSEVLGVGHYPEARLGLGRIELERKNKEEARRHLFEALDLERPLGKDGAGTFQIFQNIVQHLYMLHDLEADCKAWAVRLPWNAQPEALRNKNLIVYAQTEQRARDYLQSLLNAMQPTKPPWPLPATGWKLAPRPMQPIVPVHPGVQGIWA